MPIYVNYNSLAIKGDVTEEKHVGWIEVDSFNFGLGRGIASPTGASADRESTAPSVSEITLTKAQDAATISLVNEALQGEGQTVVIDFCKTDKDKLEVYCTYKLENCMVSGYSVSSGGDRPSESISLNFTKILYEFNEMKAKNEKGESPKAGWDIGAAKKV